MTRFACIFKLAIVALVLCTPALAEAAPKSPLEMKTEDERVVRWDLSADSVTSHNDSEIVEAKGNVYLHRGDEYLKADFARYYSSTKWVYLSGNVIVKMGRDELSATEAEFDLRSRVGWLKQGKIFISGPHTYIAGDHIDKHWGDVYTFKNAKITTCDGDRPAWSIKTDEATVEVDGYAHMAGSTLQVKDVPVAYTPFFLFPTKTTRQSGLLMPDYGRSSRLGFYYNQPYFWAIDESNDITFNLNIMEKRGVMPGIQYRTRPNSDTTGWIRFDWMYDQERITRENEGAFKDDGLVRTNPERYWLRGMYDTKFDRDWRFKADLDYVSDQYYLSEFNKGMAGFNRNREELFSLFRRDLQEKSRNRKSGILLTRDWERVSLNLSSFYTQNQYLGNGNAGSDTDTNVQRLPQFDAYLHKGRIFPNFPLEISSNLQAAYMYRRSGTRGARYMAEPALTLPLTSKYGSIIASAGISETLYNTENPSRHDIDDSRGPKQRRGDRSVPFFNIAAATEFARVYDFDASRLPLTNSTVGKSQWLGLRHSVQPRVELRQRTNVDQKDNPYYDADDRMNPRTDLVYSITNVLTRKKETVVLTKNEQGEMEPTSKISYFDLARLRVEQSYDFREATRNHDRDEYARRPYSDIFSDFQFNFNEYLGLSTRNNWSPYMNEFTRHQSGVTVTWPENATVYAGYDYRTKVDEYTRKRNEDVKYIRVGGTLDFLGPFQFSGDIYYDYRDNSNHEYDFRLSYNHQCFTIIGSTMVDPREENYQLMIVLTGLGQ